VLYPLLFIVYGLFLAAAASVIHEAFHAVVAIMAGVPVSDVSFGWYGVNPSTRFPAWFAGTGLQLAYYAGGLGAGAVVAGVYLITSARHERSWNWWVFSLLMAVVATQQVVVGIL